MRVIAVILVFFQFSCISKTPAARNTEDFILSSQPAVIDAGKIIAGSNMASTFDHGEILGIWNDMDNEPISIEIRHDSIYYSEHFESFKYKLNGDSIYIEYPDLLFSAKVGVLKDTLIFYSNVGSTKFVKLQP